MISYAFATGREFPWLMASWGTFWFWSASTSGKRLFKYKQFAQSGVSEYIEKLRTFPYETAVAEAQEHCTSFPQELALRKFHPASKEWRAYELNTIQFIIEKPELGGHTTVTII